MTTPTASSPTISTALQISTKRSKCDVPGVGIRRLAPIPCDVAKQLAILPYADVTIKTDAKTTVTIDGVAGKAVKDLVVGEKVSINPVAGTATDITAKSKHKKAKNS